MARRGIKEFKAAEALELIMADRAREELVCPSCGNNDFDRFPKRRLNDTPGEAYRQVKLTCSKCERSAVYSPLAMAQAAGI